MTKAELAQLEKDRLAPVSCSLIPQNKLYTQTNLLGAVSFGNGIPEHACTSMDVELSQCTAEPMVEIWQSNEEVQSGVAGDIHYSRNSRILFACISIADIGNLKNCTEQLYLSIFDFLQQQRASQILRVWNHFPNINDTGTELERYREFCVGRFNAFRSFYGHDFQQCIPAASAIGTSGKKINIYFIASTEPGVYLENPRQVSAYHYPAEYGPCSPSFARATLWDDAPSTLFVSGTASVVGHKSLHIGNLDKQLQETLNNIDKLLQHPKVQDRQFAQHAFPLIKIYLRRQEYLNEQVIESVQNFFGQKTQLLFLKGDICRSDLMLEVEGVCTFS